MKFKLNVRTISGGAMNPVIEELEQHLGPNIPHDRQSMRGFYIGKQWRIDLCNTHYELHVDRRHTRKPWFMLFALRWVQ
jgi:hypothetical protein